MEETSERCYGLWPTPHECPQCRAPVKVFHPASESDARRLVSAVTGVAAVMDRRESPRELLRDRCTTPAQVDQVVARVAKLDWDRWHAEFVRYKDNASTAAWNRRNLERWPELIRARDDGSLARAIAEAAEGAKADLRAWAAKWPGK